MQGRNFEEEKIIKIASIVDSYLVEEEKRKLLGMRGLDVAREVMRGWYRKGEREKRCIASLEGFGMVFAGRHRW